MIATGDEHASEIAVTAGYAPREPTARALFFFLTHQFESYAGLDFDQAHLRAAHETANADLRRRMAEVARVSGRIEWVHVVAGGRNRIHLGRMSDTEWQAVTDLLSAAARWADVWRLAQQAPPVRSRGLLMLLTERGWQPPGHDRERFEALRRLAAECPKMTPDLSALIVCRATLQGHTGEIHSLAASPDGTLLASGGSERSPVHTIRMWSLPDGAPVAAIEGCSDYVTSLAFTPGGDLLASGDGDGLVRFWRLPDGAPVATLGWHMREVTCLAFTPGGDLLASGDGDGHVRLWRLPDGALLATLEGHSDSIQDLAVTPDGTLVASASGDNTIRLWRLPDGAPVATLEGHTYSVTSLAVTPDGKLLASTSIDGTIRLWRLPEGALLLIEDGRTDSFADSLTELAVTPDGTLLASGSFDNIVRVWLLPDMVPVATLRGHTRGIRALAVSPDGALLASASLDGTIRIWSWDTARLVGLPVHRLALEGLEEARRATRAADMPPAVRAWLAFTLALVDSHRRFDIEVEVTTRVEVGEFDIEIGG